MRLVSIRNLRRGGLRAYLARACFALARLLLGEPPRRTWETYAEKLPVLDVVDLEVSKIVFSGVIEPDSHRDALLRIAQQIGRTRREVVIVRLALHDVGVLVLPQSEIDKLKTLYGLQDY